MNNVISSAVFANSKCPVGSAAILAGAGFCEVIAVDGLMRTVAFAQATPMSAGDLVKDLPSSILPHEVLFGEELEYGERTVHVSELRALDPMGDHKRESQRLAGVRAIAHAS